VESSRDAACDTEIPYQSLLVVTCITGQRSACHNAGKSTKPSKRMFDQPMDDVGRRAWPGIRDLPSVDSTACQQRHIQQLCQYSPGVERPSSSSPRPNVSRISTMLGANCGAVCVELLLAAVALKLAVEPNLTLAYEHGRVGRDANFECKR
jgi:hypothetical protein